MYELGLYRITICLQEQFIHFKYSAWNRIILRIYVGQYVDMQNTRVTILEQ